MFERILNFYRPLDEDTVKYWNQFFQFLLAVVASIWLTYALLSGGFKRTLNSVASAKVPA